MMNNKFLWLVLLLPLLFSCQKYNKAPFDEKEKAIRNFPETMDVLVLDSLWEKRDSLSYLRLKQINKILLKNSETMPNWMDRFNNLKWIIIANDKNNFENIPESIGKLKTLEIFDVSENNISKMPETLTLYNISSLKILDFDNNNISTISKVVYVKKGKYNLYNFLTIKASKPLKENILVDVLADGEICGQLKILANDSKHIKNINVIIVPVKTKFGARINTGRMVGDGESFFKQNLKQALIIPNIRYLINPLDMTSTAFKNRFSKSGVIYLDDYSVDKSGFALLNYLDAELEKKYPGRYTNSYKLYIFNDSYPDTVDPRLITQGFSFPNTKHGVFFNGHDRSTISHETLHAMKLAHTFDGIKATAKFTYKAQQTDNIMDYCHWSSDLNGNPRKPVEGKTLFFWQWHIVNPNNKLK